MLRTIGQDGKQRSESSRRRDAVDSDIDQIAGLGCVAVEMYVEVPFAAAVADVAVHGPFRFALDEQLNALSDEL